MKFELSESLFNQFTKNQNSKKNFAFGLSLTSLIDAFSILVIYLLVATQSGAKDLDISNSKDIPLAKTENKLITNSLLVQINSSDIVINKNSFKPEQIKQYINQTVKNNPEVSIIIAADKNIKFKTIQDTLSQIRLSDAKKIEFLTQRTQ